MVPESENGSPEDSFERQDQAHRKFAEAAWFALADELVRNRSLDDGDELMVPWQSVAPGDVQALMGTYRQARRAVERLKDALDGLGMKEELPGLAASVDSSGAAVVKLGAVSLGTAARLEQILRSTPPPADRYAA
ncbi:hypothetical protein [Kineosporia succinea]|uniref:Uncharacterized protein n=1 Tax=Kineosporia succinea TaxID=84632 RepID=A0ABT9P430_9ACTN|nr:hypothetical protein [Kineosporia succinea]MDP9827311.1 hypothetical protein [Kineosporia succinea]